MNPKLLALKEKLSDKLGPPLNWIGSKLSFLRSKKFWMLGTLLVLLPLGTAIGGIAYFIYTTPASKYRPMVQQSLLNFLGAEQVSIARMKWIYGWNGLGIELEDLQLENGVLFSEYKAKTFSIVINPLLWRAKIKSESTFTKLNPNLKVDQMSSPLKDPAFSTWVEKLTQIEWEYSKSDLHWSASESDWELNDISGSLSYLPIQNKFHYHLKAQMNAEDQKGSWAWVGPVSSGGRADISQSHGKTVFDFQELFYDLSQSNFAGFTMIEKLADIPLRFELRPKLHFSDWKLVSYEFEKGSISYDQTQIEFSGSYQPEGIINIAWNRQRSEEKALRLPFPYLRKAPGKGVVDTNGDLKLRLRDFTFVEGQWRFTLNNFTFDAAQVLAYAGIHNSTQGPLKVSFVSEGNIFEGIARVPRSELQIEATEAQVEIASLVKSKGDAANLLFRFKQEEEAIKIDECRLNLHTMSLGAAGSIKSWADYLANKAPLGLDLSLRSNNVDLSQWNSYFPVLRSIPLQGFFQVGTSVVGSIKPFDADYKDLGWKVEKLQLSNVQGAIGDTFVARSGLLENEKYLSGPFKLNLFFSGRGKGSLVDQGTLLSQIRLTDANIHWGEVFRKPSGIDLELDLAAEQSRTTLKLSRASLKLHELDLDLSGTLVQGSERSRLKVEMKRPIALKEWKQIFPRLDRKTELGGSLMWRGDLGFPRPDTMEAGLDWGRLSLTGELKIDNVESHLGALRGKLLMQRGQWTIPELNFNYKGSPVQLSGVLRSRDFSRGFNWDWLQGRVDSPVEGELQVSLSSWNMDDLFPVLASTPSSYQWPAWILSEGWPSQSRLDIGVDIQKGKLAGHEFSKFKSKLEWRQGILNARPSSMNLFGGSIQGAFNVDFSPMYKRKDPPLWSATLKLSKVNLIEMNQFLGQQEAGWGAIDSASGQLTLSSVGMNSKDWQENLQGRFLGSLEGARAPWISVLQKEINQFTQNPELADYVIKEQKNPRCFSGPLKVETDAQISRGAWDYERLRVSDDAKNRIDMKGQFSAGNPQISGLLALSESCLGTSGVLCAQGLGSEGRVPFNLSKRGDSLALNWGVNNLSDRFRDCFEAQVKKRIEAELQKSQKAQ